MYIGLIVFLFVFFKMFINYINYNESNVKLRFEVYISL